MDLRKTARVHDGINHRSDLLKFQDFVVWRPLAVTVQQAPARGIGVSMSFAQQ